MRQIHNARRERVRAAMLRRLARTLDVTFVSMDPGLHAFRLEREHRIFVNATGLGPAELKRRARHYRNLLDAERPQPLPC